MAPRRRGAARPFAPRGPVFLPIGDTPNPRFTPWVNYGLIAANVLIFLALVGLTSVAADANDPDLQAYLRVLQAERGASISQLQLLARQMSAYDLMIWQWGVRPSDPGVLQVFTAMFLHGGWMHLAGNMLFLWIYGDNVEHRLGRLGYLGFYLGTGVLASLGDVMLRWGSDVPSVGASGAISGVLGAYFLWFPENRVRVFVAFFPFFFRIVEIGARWVLGFYLVFNNLLPLLLSGGESGGVSYGAHIGGFVAGAAGALLLDRAGLERPEADILAHTPAAAAKLAHPAPSPDSGFKMASGGVRASFRRALERGEWQEAGAVLFNLPRHATREALTELDKVDLGLALEEARHPHAALAAYERALRDHPHGLLTAQAHLGMARVMLEQLAMPTDAFQHVRAALAAATDADERAEAEALLQLVHSGTRTAPDVIKL